MKASIFERGVRVPGFVLGPDVPVGTSPDLIHAADLYATLAELGGAEIPEGAGRDSQSMVPVLRGRPHTRSSLLVQFYGPNGVAPRETDMRAAIHRSGHKVRWEDPDGAGPIPARTTWTTVTDEDTPLDPATLPSDVTAELLALLAAGDASSDE